MIINIIQLSGIVLLCLAAGGVIGFLIRKKIIESRIDAIEKYSKKILAEAQKEAKALKTEAALQAKDAVYQMKLDFEKETKERRHQFQIQEKRLFNKEESLDRKIDQLEKREGRISVRESSIDRIEKDLTNKQGEFEQVLAEQRRQLEKLAGISRDEAKQMLISSMEEEAKHDAAKLVRKIEAEAKEQSDRKAQEIISLAIKRYAGDYVAEKTVSVVALPSDEMKGRIIGREGRNIRAIEAATGIDF